MFTTRPTLQGTFGMVSATHWLASSAAMAVLEDGGNAFDGAVAAAFVLHVAEPHLNGPGGEVPIVLAPAGEEPTVICGQGPAPMGASLNRYKALGLDSVPASGPLAAAVPGAFDAWMLLLRDHGTKALGEVLKYAIGYAENGIPVVENISTAVEEVAHLFAEHWTGSADVYLPGGRPPRPGDLLKNKPLAATWLRLLRESGSAGTRERQIDAARRVWREGFISEAIDATAAQPSVGPSGERHVGTLTGHDIASFSATYEQPERYTWRDWTVFKPGPWSQGPVLLQQLALLPDSLEYGTAEYVHTLIEGTKLAMADREAWYGDAEEVPMAALLSKAYNSARRDLIETGASLELRPGSPNGREPRLCSHPADSVAWTPGMGEPTVAGDAGTRGDTCHIDVADRWGNLVAATPSGGWLQSNPLIPSLGFALGTRLQMTWLEPGLANTLTPGKRPRTTLTPSMAVQAGGTRLAFGSPGGDSQDQWNLHFFLAAALRERVRGGLDLQGAIDAPNWHSESFPDSFYPHPMHQGAITIESRIGPEIIANLRNRGHLVSVGDPWSEGRLCAVACDPQTGLISAAANPRGMQGYAVGR